ncbi:MFS transporter [Bradyrhizobium erythrophlei]|jgi:MFS family permease|uniref:Na+/melibiose symporter n=1 Tax=Bradyrhizobium erythrophlei TaxID=1437360 RepID=A0A1M5V8D9_9BRAD|nr:MFS transporter [Bradyrhizobium erythrophlei]SHH71354.1 Na+/melibiose symporter [Bradyrhizobium erythrophlei]
MSHDTGKIPSATWRSVPATVWTLGFVSLLMDVSSELIHSLLPVFLTSVVGASAADVGLIEGIAEATAAVAKVFSGAFSDRIGKRKLLVGLGYGLSAVTKPIFPLAGTAWEVLAARFVDRVGKGIRDAPRDALIADITPPAVRGAGYGIRQALDTVGAFVGPLSAVALMTLYAGNFRAVFWWALLPASLAVLLIVIGVREPAGTRATARRGWPVRKEELKRMPAAFWVVIAIGVVFALARFSEAFLLLKAQAEGLALALIPLVLVWMNLVYAITATPAGILSDKIGRVYVLLCGLGALLVADLALAFIPGLGGVVIGVGLWGLYLGFSQGSLSALVADTAPEDLRGTAFGLFNLVTGGALLAASVVAGWLWSEFGPTATFSAGAVFSGLAILIVAVGIKARY